MIIEMKVSVDVPNGYYCKGCGACKKSELTKNTYCEINGELLRQAKDGRFIKTSNCFAEIRKKLMNDG